MIIREIHMSFITNNQDVFKNSGRLFDAIFGVPVDHPEASIFVIVKNNRRAALALQCV